MQLHMRRPSLSSVVVKSIDADIVRRAVDDYATRLLAQRDDIEEIVIFGSFTKGTYAPGSDIDLLVVLTWSDQPVRDRIPGLLPGAFPVGIDLFPYTRKELERLVSPGLLREMRASQWRYRRTDSTGEQVRTTDLYTGD